MVHGVKFDALSAAELVIIVYMAFPFNAKVNLNDKKLSECLV